MSSSVNLQPGLTYEWTLAFSSDDDTALAQSIPMLEEMIWTLEGVQSIEQVFRPDTQDVMDYTLDGVSSLAHVQGLKVFAASRSLGDDIRRLLAETSALSGWMLAKENLIQLEDWAESWKRHWDVTPIIPGVLTICPSWLTYQPQSSSETVITLDPGAAFGTGTHQTTSLMLQGIYQHWQHADFSQISVLDVGTGSGVLAVYSAMLGCKSVMGVDNDSASPAAAAENAERNGVSDACAFYDTPLEDLCQTRHELVLANIIAPVIIDLLPQMRLRLAPGGYLMLSGLIENNLPQLLDAVSRERLRVVNKRHMGDWLALDLKAE